MIAKRAPAALRPLDQDLHWLLARLARGLGVAEEAAVRHHGLSLRSYVVLSEIGTARTPASQLAVASSAVIDKSVLVGLLDELETAGLVKRTSDPCDRRTKLLTVTDQGRRVLVAAQADVREVEAKLLAELLPQQRRDLVAVLRTAVRSGLAATFDTKPAV